MSLLVQDDGQGFDPKSGWQAERFGLRAMTERARELGATVDVNSLAGWGTRIRARFPYRRDEEQAGPRLRVLVAAGQPVLRAGLARLLSWNEPGIEVIGEVATAEQALDACRTLRPDVVLVDLGLPAGDGLDDGGGGPGGRDGPGHGVAGVLLGHDPGLAVVGLCEAGDERRVSDAMRAGARGCVGIRADGPELARSVVAAGRGQAILSGPVLTQLHRGLRADDLEPPLTGREREVRSLMEQGLPDKLIAERLVLSVKTVEKHAGAVLRKTGARNRRSWPGGRGPGKAGKVGEALPANRGFPPIRSRGTARVDSPCCREEVRVPVVPLKEIVDRAFAERYGVAAINVVNDLTLEAVLAAAVEQRSPVIVQTSVKTVRSVGLDLLFAMWRELTAGIEVPVSLHLDHCPDRDVLSACLRKGWNSVLFDASSLPVEENQRQTVEVVAEARSLRRERRRRDRGHHRRGGRHRLRRGGAAAVAAGGAGFHQDDRGRRLRAGHRQRARRLPRRAAPRRAAGLRHRGRRADPHRAARRHRDDRRPVHRPDRPRLRQGQHLHRAQGHLHAGQPGVPARGRGTRQLGPAVAVQRGPRRGTWTWPPTTCAASAASARPGEDGSDRLHRPGR